MQCGFCTPGLIVATHDLLARNPSPIGRRDPRGAGRQPVPLHGLREDPRRGPAGRAAHDARHRGLRGRDRRRRRYRARDGHVVIEGNRITAVGPGPARRTAGRRGSTRRGCLATPGLINCHHHLYQWATRGLAQQATLFEWLVELYPIVGADRRARSSAPPRAPAWPRCCAPAARPRPTTTTSSRAAPATCSRSRSRRRASSASASTPAAARWTSGASHGGLPPDEVVEDRDAILAAYDDALDALPRPVAGLDAAGSRSRPCSPFSVTQRADGARPPSSPAQRGVRLHTHMAETVEEEAFCLELFGVRPVEYLERARLARRRRLARPLRAPRRARGRALRRDAAPASRTARRSNARLGAGIAPVVPLVARGRAGRARRRRRRLQRGGRAGRRAAPGAAARAAARRPGGADRARGARARHDRTARAASAATTSSARSSRASSPTSRCGGSTTSTTPGIADPVAALVLGAAAARATRCSSAADGRRRGRRAADGRRGRDRARAGAQAGRGGDA